MCAMEMCVLFRVSEREKEGGREMREMQTPPVGVDGTWQRDPGSNATM